LAVDGAAPAPAVKRPNVQMPDEYLPPNKILFLQNLPESVTKDQLMALFSQFVFASLSPLVALTLLLRRYPNLYEVRLIPTKKDIAFVEYADEASAGVAKDALHNYKLDGENKIKVCLVFPAFSIILSSALRSPLRENKCPYVYHVSVCYISDSHTIHRLRESQGQCIVWTPSAPPVNSIGKAIHNLDSKTGFVI
jgi:hypothetical protein